MTQEDFKLKVPQGSEIIGTNFQVKLDGIPSDALDLWKKGSNNFEIKKEGLRLLESISYTELQNLLAVRVLVGFKTEITLLKKLLKEKSNDAGAVKTFKSSK